MPNATKVEKVRELTESFKDAEAALFADFRGLSVHDASELRTALAEIEARFSVVKNTLTRLAVREAGMDGVEAFLEGPTAITLAKGDPVAVAKRLVDAAKKFPVLEIKGGFAEGRVLTADDIRELASLESREAMLSKIAGLAKSQMSRTAFMLQALQSKFLSLLDAYKEKLPAETATEGGDAAPPAPPAPDSGSAPSDAGSTDAAASAEESGAEGEGAPDEETVTEDRSEEGEGGK